MGRIYYSGKRENGKRGGFRLGGCTTKSAVSAAAVAPASAIATASSGHLQEARHQTSEDVGFLLAGDHEPLAEEARQKKLAAALPSVA